MLYQLSYQSCCSAATRDRTRDLQIFSLTLSQLSYSGESVAASPETCAAGPDTCAASKKTKGGMGELNPRPLLP